MTDATTSAAPVPGLFSRLIGVIFSPKAIFEKLVPSPRVFGALAIVGLVLSAFASFFIYLMRRARLAAGESGPDAGADLPRGDAGSQVRAEGTAQC